MNDHDRFKAQHEESMAVLNAMIAKLDASRATKDGLLGEISKLHMNSFMAGIAAARTLKRIPNRFDSMDRSGYGSLFEIVARDSQGEEFRCVLEADNKREAREIFCSLPGVRGEMEIRQVNRLLDNFYWAQD